MDNQNTQKRTMEIMVKAGMGFRRNIKLKTKINGRMKNQTVLEISKFLQKGIYILQNKHTPKALKQ